MDSWSCWQTGPQDVDTHCSGMSVRAFTHYLFLNCESALGSFWQLYFHSTGFAQCLSSLHPSLFLLLWLLPFKHTRILLVKSWFPFSPWMCLFHRLSKEPSGFLIKQGWSTQDKLKACCSLCTLFFQGFSFHLSGFLELLRMWEINAALNQGPESYLKLRRKSPTI